MCLSSYISLSVQTQTKRVFSLKEVISTQISDLTKLNISQQPQKRWLGHHEKKLVKIPPLEWPKEVNPEVKKKLLYFFLTLDFFFLSASTTKEY